MTELLRIAIPNGEVIERHLPHREITLGRDRANAIVIDHPSVARWHVRFVPEFSGWAVVDLESAGGTYLDGQRLEPGVASPLGRGVALRIGEVQGILTEAKGEDINDEDIVVAAETFAIAVQPLSEPITPGEHGALTLEIHNIGEAADDFRISVPSLPAEWVEIHPPTLSLAPGARDEATILVKPPRHPDARHGHHDVTISVVSRLRPREERELTSVSFEQYVETNAAIHPPEGIGDYVLSLRNDGNAPVEFDLLAATEAVGVTIEMAEHSVHLQPGQGREIEVRVKGVQRPLWRPMRPHPITVSAKARSVENAHEVSVLRHRPPRYPWLPYAILTAIAGVVVLSAWAFEWWWFD